MASMHVQCMWAASNTLCPDSWVWFSFLLFWIFISLWYSDIEYLIFTYLEFEKVLRWILDQGASVNFYMFHGGTNFGFMSGANEELGMTNDSGTVEPYVPDVTSYGENPFIHLWFNLDSLWSLWYSSSSSRLSASQFSNVYFLWLVFQLL